MKLLHYTYWKLSLFLFIILTGWGILFYITILDEVVDETDDSLQNYRSILVNTALKDPSVLSTRGNIMTMYEFRKITPDEAENYSVRFYDSTVYIEIEDEDEPVRVMESCFRMPDGQFYEVILSISTLEREDMIEAMLYYLISLYVLLFVSMLVITRIVLKKAFYPLDRLMEWLRNIRPGEEVPPLNNDTSIREFIELSNAAVDMSNRSYKAYQQQKEFIENASHELQTPLAIARNKIELMAENTALDESQMKDLNDIYLTLSRVVKLNKSLLLLSRIENGQYTGKEEVNINEIVSNTLPDLLDIYEEKEIEVQQTENGEFTIQSNKQLAQIVLNNLLKNALSHTDPSGRIIIEINKNSFIIKNTGETPLEPEKIFQRFYHPQTGNKDSVGLGLAIARSIANSYDLTLQYKWDGMHCFILSKN